MFENARSWRESSSRLGVTKKTKKGELRDDFDKGGYGARI
jgi:hypothetical protein